MFSVSGQVRERKSVMAKATYNKDQFTLHLSPPELQSVRAALLSEVYRIDGLIRETASRLDRAAISNIEAVEIYESLLQTISEAQAMIRVLAVVSSPQVVDGHFV
jgi:hypothetical protein